MNTYFTVNKGNSSLQKADEQDRQPKHKKDKSEVMIL